MKHLALLRGINVGGQNIINMKDLKVAFEKQGFENVFTYINSGNVIFDSSTENVILLKALCEQLIKTTFNLEIIVCVVSATTLHDALCHVPSWWHYTTDTKHNTFFVIPPHSAEDLIDFVGPLDEQYERIAYHGSIIFWSAPIATFTKTRWSRLSQDKLMYSRITVRNSNTTLKLAEQTK